MTRHGVQIYSNQKEIGYSCLPFTKSYWNLFVQIVNAIPGRNLPVLNFACHLPRPWTDQFAHVNGKQPTYHLPILEPALPKYTIYSNSLSLPSLTFYGPSPFRPPPPSPTRAAGGSTVFIGIPSGSLCREERF